MLCPSASMAKTQVLETANSRLKRREVPSPLASIEETDCPSRENRTNRPPETSARKREPSGPPAIGPRRGFVPGALVEGCQVCVNRKFGVNVNALSAA